MPYCEANGARIHYRLDGDSARPLVMLSNSLATDMRMWDPQMPSLLERYRVLRYDKRGHGESEAVPGPYSIELLSRDALAILEELDLRQVHFVGLSIGGMAGQWIGGNEAERLASLTLCDTASELDPAIWDGRIKLAEETGMAGLVEPTLQRWFTAPFLERQAPILPTVREMIAGTSLDGYLGCAKAIRAMSLAQYLPAIALPTNIIVGAEDPATPVAKSEAIHAAIAGSALTVIPDAAHLPNIEKPEEFNAALLPFLERQSSAASA